MSRTPPRASASHPISRPDFARGPLESDRFGLSYQSLAPDFRIPFGHRHADEEEVYVVIRGSGRIALGDEVIEVREMDAIRVAPDVDRGFEAGPDGAELLVFGAGYEAKDGQASGDAEMQPGWWPEA